MSGSEPFDSTQGPRPSKEHEPVQAGSSGGTDRLEQPDGSSYLVSADGEVTAGPPISEYTQEHAAKSLVRAVQLVGWLTLAGTVLAWWRGGWRSAALLLVGAAIAASGLWEWRRLMAALMSRMEVPDATAAAGALAGEAAAVKRPSIGFAVAGFIVRLMVVGIVLYVSLKYLHGSVLALAAGLAMGVVALTVEGLRLLRSDTI